jgi:ferritin-like metal-binding protein YciE
MIPPEQKIVQYLNEAHGMEQALVRVLQSQIAMTPRGSYRNSLESHLLETRSHAERVTVRLDELEQGRNPLQLGIGLLQSVLGQVLALGKTPLDLVRGTGGRERVLKNAKDSCAAEALEIATYTAIERLAGSVGDNRTASLAASIRADEQRMYDRLIEQLPKLTDAMLADETGRRPASRTSATRSSPSPRRSSRKPAKKAARRGSNGSKPAARRESNGAKPTTRRPQKRAAAGAATNSA